ncbi:MAG: photosynthetic complex assembly protein PuhC [Xanthomonadaceae bacterium]|nr:photosynthetic complex assembly protein PuhC [Xanthomonadaceae bacterium]
MNEASPYARNMNMRFPLYAVLAAIALAFALAIEGRIEKRDAVNQDETAQPIAERTLRFDDLANGDIGIFDADSGKRIDTIAPGQDNFMRGMVRALVRERRKAGIGRDTPFRLSMHSDGHLLLADPATGEVLDLGSFGSENIGDFARLLPTPSPMKAADASAVAGQAG